MSRKMIRIGNQDYPIEYFYTEITNENVNKWKAIEKLIEIEKINQADTVGIGDNLNDKELIQNSGLGILMANADPKMQEYSDVMTDDNNSDGVGKAIYKYQKAEAEKHKTIEATAYGQWFDEMWADSYAHLGSNSDAELQKLLEDYNNSSSTDASATDAE
jgi:hypothetical protein